MTTLVEAVNRGLAKFGPDYITSPASAIYRIYRDTRFSKDKTPYKTHIAASLWKRGFTKHACGGLYFSVSPKEIEFAGGVYMPGPEQLLAIRRHISEHHARFRKLTMNAKLVSLMEPLKGAALSRVPKGFDPTHPAADLIQKKQWLYFMTMEPSVAGTPQLLEEVLNRFRAMMPVVEFLNEPLKPAKVTIEDLLG